MCAVAVCVGNEGDRGEHGYRIAGSAGEMTQRTPFLLLSFFFFLLVLHLLCGDLLQALLFSLHFLSKAGISCGHLQCGERLYQIVLPCVRCVRTGRVAQVSWTKKLVVASLDRAQTQACGELSQWRCHTVGVPARHVRLTTQQKDRHLDGPEQKPKPCKIQRVAACGMGGQSTNKGPVRQA